MLIKKEELIGFANQYLEALAERNPSRLPLSGQIRYTENTQEMKIGEGLWKTASSVQYRHIVADPVQGQMGIFCTLQEGGEHLTIAAFRLKVEDKKITEVETMVSRYAGQDVAFNPKVLVSPVPILVETVPMEERVSRERMVEIADLYLEGLEKNSAECIPLHPDCNRLENGLKTTNNQKLGFPLSLSCAEQIPIFTYMTKIRDRRYMVVDEELGLVWCLVMFDVPGTVKTATLPGYGEIQLAPRTQYPRSMLVAELFKIRGGLIHYIEALLTSVPLGTQPGWPVYKRS
ncbi:MAG: hypothetical protein AB1585_09995 [Thermodesulfobacteriota bacterium]